MSPAGDITSQPGLVDYFSQIDRYLITWQFSTPVQLVSGTAKTLAFSVTTAVNRGNYWNDLQVDFGDESFLDAQGVAENIYTWPTALVSVKDVFDVTANDDGGNASLIDLNVWIGDLTGEIKYWDLK